MAEGDIDTVIDSFVFRATGAWEPVIINIDGDIYAIVYRDVDTDGWIATIDISAAGDIGAARIDHFEFEPADCINPSIIHISGDIYAIAYNGPGNDGFIITISIDSAGNIGAAVIDSLEYCTSNVVRP